jgi:DNA-binding transcriptional regulator YiaG
MSKNFVNEYVYDGLGFPVKLRKVEMVVFQNELHPKIDVRKVADKAIQALLAQTEKITGNQIIFFRIYFSMSQKKLAKLVNEPLKVVKQWEEFQNKPINMDAATETVLRQHIKQHISSHPLTTTGMFSSKQKKPKQPPAADADDIPTPKKKG